MRFIFTIIMGLLLVGPGANASTAPFFNPFAGNNNAEADAYVNQLQPPPIWIIKGLNMRDAGGWTMPGKGTMPYGKVYRATGLEDLLEGDREKINALGLKTIIDFRTTENRNKYPDDPEILEGVTEYHLEIDYDGAVEEYAQLDPESDEWYGPDGIYIFLLNRYKEQYVEMLKLVGDPDNHPLLYHCFFGKDRTGVASALILSLLKVPEEEIVRDFLLSNEALNSIVGSDIEFVAEEDMRALLEWLGEVENILKIGIGRSIVVQLETTFAPQGVLVPRGATWKYNDLGPVINVDPQVSEYIGIEDGSWKQPGFVDNRWASGTALFGFSSSVKEISTQVQKNYETEQDDRKRVPVYYFRHEFQVEQGELPGAMLLNARVDDSAVIFLNGREAQRINLPEGFDPDTDTYSNMESFPDEFKFFYLNSDLLVQGTNVIAVQVHQKNEASSDMLFDLELGRAPGTGIIARILGPSGVPMPQLQVDFKDETVGRPGAEYSLVTDSEGEIDLMLAPGTYRLSVDDERFEPAHTSFTVTAGQNRTTISLDLVWKIVETTPIEAIEADSSWKYWPATLDQALGEPTPSGWNTLSFSDDSWVESRGAVIVDAGEPGSFPLPLAPAATVRGADNEVVLETGVPMRMLFRREFNLDRVGNITEISLEHRIDYGAVFYLNGVEVDRYTMEDDSHDVVSVKRSLTGDALTHLVRGKNVLAVELFGLSDMVGVLQYVAGHCSQSSDNPALYEGCEFTGLEFMKSVEFNMGDFAETFLSPGQERFEELGQKIAFSSDLTFDLSLSMVLSPEVQVVGRIVDISGKSVPGLRVQVEGGETFTHTTSSGRFNLPSPMGWVTLLIDIPDDPYIRKYRHQIEVPPAGLGDLSVILPSADERPVYETIRMESPQIIAAGMSPSIIESTAGFQQVSLLAVVRPGDRPLLGVDAMIGGKSRAMKRSGSLGNNDEIWTFEIQLQKGAAGYIFAEEQIEWIKARDELRRESPAFPLYRYSNRSQVDDDSSTLELPFCTLDSSAAKRPQLIACGQSPAIISTDDASVRILAIVRPGENPLESVLLDGGDCNFCTTTMNPVGRLTNGDYIYEGSFSVPPGFNNEERDMTEDGWSVMAFDDKGGVSNACFHVEWAQ